MRKNNNNNNNNNSYGYSNISISNNHYFHSLTLVEKRIFLQKLARISNSLPRVKKYYYYYDYSDYSASFKSIKSFPFYKNFSYSDLYDIDRFINIMTTPRTFE